MVDLNLLAPARSFRRTGMGLLTMVLSLSRIPAPVLGSGSSELYWKRRDVIPDSLPTLRQRPSLIYGNK